jgi:hypothetical protein
MHGTIKHKVWLSLSTFCLLDIVYRSPNTGRHRCVSQYIVDRFNSAILPTNTRYFSTFLILLGATFCLYYKQHRCLLIPVSYSEIQHELPLREKATVRETDRHRQRQRTTDLMTTSKILTSLFHTKNLNWQLPSQHSWFLNYHAPQQKAYIH